MARNNKNIIKHILVVIDGSEASFRAAEHAVRLAKQLRCKATALAVVDTELLNRLLKSRIFVEEEKQEYERDLERSSLTHLEHAARQAAKQGVKFETLLLKGSMHRTVIAQADSIGADIIVLGKWRYSRTERDIIAAERQRILIEASCPVLVVG